MTDPLEKTEEEKGDKIITTESKYNNNKQNMATFYNKWKKYREIQLRKAKMDLNKSKLKNIKAYLDLVPNFPGSLLPNAANELSALSPTLIIHQLPPGG